MLYIHVITFTDVYFFIIQIQSIVPFSNNATTPPTTSLIDTEHFQGFCSVLLFKRFSRLFRPYTQEQRLSVHGIQSKSTIDTAVESWSGRLCLVSSPTVVFATLLAVESRGWTRCFVPVVAAPVPGCRSKPALVTQLAARKDQFDSEIITIICNRFRWALSISYVCIYFQFLKIIYIFNKLEQYELLTILSFAILFESF